MLKGIIVLVFLSLAIGTTILATFEDVAYLFICKFCPEGQEATWNGFRDIVLSGQRNIREGVAGMIELRDNPGDISDTMYNGLVGQYKSQIYIGIMLILFMWVVFYMGINLVVDKISFYPPAALAFLLAFIAVGILEVIFSQGGWPYAEFVDLISNTWIWDTKLTELASPIPIEAMDYVNKTNLSI